MERERPARRPWARKIAGVESLDTPGVNAGRHVGRRRPRRQRCRDAEDAVGGREVEVAVPVDLDRVLGRPVLGHPGEIRHTGHGRGVRRGRQHDRRRGFGHRTDGAHRQRSATAVEGLDPPVERTFRVGSGPRRVLQLIDRPGIEDLAEVGGRRNLDDVLARFLGHAAGIDAGDRVRRGLAGGQIVVPVERHLVRDWGPGRDRDGWIVGGRREQARLSRRLLSVGAGIVERGGLAAERQGSAVRAVPINTGHDEPVVGLAGLAVEPGLTRRERCLARLVLPIDAREVDVLGHVDDVRRGIRIPGPGHLLGLTDQRRASADRGIRLGLTFRRLVVVPGNDPVVSGGRSPDVEEARRTRDHRPSAGREGLDRPVIGSGRERNALVREGRIG